MERLLATTGPSKAFPSENGLVAQILCEFYDSEDTLIGAGIQKLERPQSFYDAQLHEVQLRYRAVTEALEDRRSILRRPVTGVLSIQDMGCLFWLLIRCAVLLGKWDFLSSGTSARGSK
ncbi:hypothetical protein ARMGADRAFT_1038878 [Armillaria gallica]|uniref:Uncharacterized protein n=1 Tax=Armillaria gallica TaxID=47427 RepID=A0A2H3CG99_ARMGA|nr:hypothetical protein ARMGADRAFT_1038878 [Armillaria gallica]